MPQLKRKQGISVELAYLLYDLAQRIGAYKGFRLKPDEVYLHRGSKEGANALSVGWGKRKVERKEFPPELQDLEPQFIEDFLCLYKQDLLRLKASNPANQADS